MDAAAKENTVYCQRIEGKTIVAFESVSQEGKEIAIGRMDSVFLFRFVPEEKS